MNRAEPSLKRLDVLVAAATATFTEPLGRQRTCHGDYPVPEREQLVRGHRGRSAAGPVLTDVALPQRR